MENQKISPKEYLSYCITQHWIDISQLNVDENMRTQQKYMMHYASIF